VFLSYSRRDKDLVARIAEGLMAAGFLPDFDQAAHDPDNVSAGISAEDEWWKRLQEMIAAADVMVFLVSPDSAVSAVCDEEIAYARALGKRIIAVLAREVDFAKAPPRLSALNVRIDFSEGGPGFDAALAGLTRALEMNVGWHREGRKYYARVQEWDVAGRPKSRLLREGAVEEAERWALARPRNEPEPGELFLAWIAASRQQIKRDAAVRAFWRRVTAVFVVTTLVATLAGAWFVVSGQRNLGRSESLMLARASDKFYNDGDYVRALKLAILASRNTFLSPSSEHARVAFARSAQSLKLVRTIALDDTGAEMDAGVTKMVPALDGQRLLVSATDGRVDLYDVETGRRLAGPLISPGEASGEQVRVSGDGKRALVMWADRAYLLDMQTGGVSAELTPRGEQAHFTDAQISPDGRRVILAEGQNGLCSLRDGTSGEVIAELGGDGATWEIAYSADGRVAMTSTAGAVSLWDGVSGAPISAPMKFREAIALKAALSPDGRALIVSDGNRTVLRDVASGAERPVAAGANGLREVYFAPARNRFVTVDSGGNVKLWALDSGAQIGETQRSDTGEGSVQVSAESGLYLAKSYVGGVRILSLDTGAVIAEEGAEGEETFTGARLLPGMAYLLWDGRQVIRQQITATMLDPEADYYDDIPDSRMVVVSEHPGFIEEVSVSPDGSALLTYNSEKQVYQWDMRLGLQTAGPLANTSYWAVDGYLDGGAHIFTVDYDRVHIWKSHEGERLPVPEAVMRGEIYNTVVAPRGTHMLAVSESGIGVIWDIAAGKAVGGDVLLGDGSWSGVFDAGGTSLAISFENVIQLIDLSTGEARAPLIELDSWVGQMAFTEDGRRLVTADGEGAVQVWDVARLEALGPAHGHTAFTEPVLTSAGNRVAVWTGAEARLVNTETGEAVGAPLAHGAQEEIFNARFSADGRVLVTWSAAELRAWDAETGAERIAAIALDDELMDVALSPDGARLMAFHTGSVRFLDSRTGSENAPRVEAAGVSGGALSPDAQIAVMWDSEGRVTLWDVARGVSIGNPILSELPVQQAEFSRDGQRVMLAEPGGIFRVLDTRTGDVLAQVYDPSSGEGIWDEAAGRLLTVGLDGRLKWFDIAPALRTGAAREDIDWVCTAKLSGSVDAGGVVAVRRLDRQSVFEAPILRGREGEDVCAPVRVPLWERAAGAVFGWAFR
jgi:WD40 repeat protein